MNSLQFGDQSQVSWGEVRTIQSGLSRGLATFHESRLEEGLKRVHFYDLQVSLHHRQVSV